MEANKKPIWKLVERKNFHKDVAAWEEHLLKDGITSDEAESFIDANNDRILFAYIPHYSGGGMEAIIYNQKYVDSVRLERKTARLIG